jgi:hypothetical protein
MLGMAFVNALNEAARDSDVIRMFGEGKGIPTLASACSHAAAGALCE